MYVIMSSKIPFHVLFSRSPKTAFVSHIELLQKLIDAKILTVLKVDPCTTLAI